MSLDKVWQEYGMWAIKNWDGVNFSRLFLKLVEGVGELAACYRGDHAGVRDAMCDIDITLNGLFIALGMDRPSALAVRKKTEAS